MELIQILSDFIKSQGDNFFQQAGIIFNESMKNHTSFKTGGKAKVFASPKTKNTLIALINFAKSKGIRYFILGGGSNVLFCDEDFEGLVINTENLNSISVMKEIIEENNQEKVLVKCECGKSTNSFVNFCCKEGLSGAEEFAGLPGTTGGAVFMNARCFNKEISDIFYSAEYLTCDGNIEEISFKSEDWDYKKSPFTNSNSVILSVTFKLNKNALSKEELSAKCRYFIEERKSKGHFNFPCAGSVFKNNRAFGKPSGVIIDNCGLKGLSIGGAKVADFHGNIIINTGNATSSEIIQLVKSVQKEVKNKTGFLLEPEIIFIQP